MKLFMITITLLVNLVYVLVSQSFFAKDFIFISAVAPKKWFFGQHFFLGVMTSFRFKTIN